MKKKWSEYGRKGVDLQKYYSRAEGHYYLVRDDAAYERMLRRAVADYLHLFQDNRVVGRVTKLLNKLGDNAVEAMGIEIDVLISD